ncbi:hypothetical protein ACVWXM_007745 [Bradyrhizobium sp. GM7.3]
MEAKTASGPSNIAINFAVAKFDLSLAYLLLISLRAKS